MITSRPFDNTIVVATHGNGMYSNKIFNPSAVAEIKNSELSATSFPNPFNQTVSILLNEEVKGEAVSEIFDMHGALIKKIKANNSSSFTWNGNDFSNRPCANGIYFVRLSANGKSAIKKIVKQE